jgi:protease I
MSYYSRGFEMILRGNKVALLLADGFDADQYFEIHQQLMNAGILVSIVGEKADQILRNTTNTTEVEVEVAFSEARGYSFDSAIITGKFSPDSIRANDNALSLVKDIFDKGGLLGSVDHGAQVLISAGLTANKNLTGSQSIKKDIANSNGRYQNDPVVIDDNLITARGPEDIAAFCEAIILRIKAFNKHIA